MLRRWKRRLGQTIMERRRRRLSQRYIQGHGIEIGALHHPLPVGLDVQVSYVDHLDLADLRHHYPELSNVPLVKVDRIDDAGSLATFDDDSLHFVIACHLLEHCEDPLSALGHWLRVLKREGILFLAVPDRRFTFDRRRPNTTFEHLLRDALEGPEASRLQHYLEWVERVEGLPEGDRLDRAQELIETHYSIHFHVWDAASLKELFTRWMADAETPAELVRVCRNRSENLAILRKTGP